ncbi:MAG: porin [Candidatus Eisenbacteria bacterium]
MRSILLLAAMSFMSLVPGPRAACAEPIAAIPDSVGRIARPDSTHGSGKLALPRLSGYVQFRETVQSRVGATATLPRARLNVDGPLPMGFSYRVLAEFQSHSGGSTTAGAALRDAYIKWGHKAFALSAGQLTTPFCREWWMSPTTIETAERSIASDALATHIDVGVMGEWSRGEAFTIAAGAFNGEGQNVFVNRDSTTVLIARVTGRPVTPLTVGGSVATFGSDSTRYGIELNLDARPVLLRGEFLGQKRAGIDSRDEGWYALLVVRVLPALGLVGRQEELHRPTYAPEGALERGTTVGLLSDFGGGHLRAILDYTSHRAGIVPARTKSVIAQLQARFF